MRDKKKEAGKYNRRIRFEAPPTGQESDFGTPDGIWTPVATVWAWIEDVLPSRAETSASDIRVGQKPTCIRTRYRGDITSAMRIVLIDRGDALLKIVSGPAELGRKGGLEMMAVEFSSQGDAA